MRPLAHTLKQYIQRRDKQDANHRRHQHPAEYRGADDPPALRPGAGGEHHRHNADNKRHRGHHYRAEAAGSPLARSVDYRQPLLAPAAGELNDQNRILRRQGDQQHQPYLNIHIVGIARGPQPEQRSADGEQHREHDARRQRPALILRHQNSHAIATAASTIHTA